MSLQLGSLDPRFLSNEFIDAIAGKVAPKFHISLQSGCDATLQRMNRNYSTQDFKSHLITLRNRFPGAFVSCDVIVGFPGESDLHFSQSRDFVRRCKFDYVHVFPFSPRPNTPAASLPNRLDSRTMSERASAMGSVGLGHYEVNEGF
jgi:threonylcarbamoyladenosine tRNA methylthiotransferase MtaB